MRTGGVGKSSILSPHVASAATFGEVTEIAARSLQIAGTSDDGFGEADAAGVVDTSPTIVDKTTVPAVLTTGELAVVTTTCAPAIGITGCDVADDGDGTSMDTVAAASEVAAAYDT